MKKFMILAALMLIGAVQGFCQEADNRYYEVSEESGRPKGFWGVRLNMDITFPSEVTNGDYGMDMFNPGAGFSAGVIYNAPINKRFYFEPGLYLQYHTTGMKDDYTDGVDVSMRELALRIPLQFGVKFPTRTGFFAISTGPGLSFGLSGKEHASGYGEKVSVDMYKDGIRRYDINWSLGLSIHFKDYVIGVNGYYGLLNAFKEGDGATWHQNYLTIGFGYNFR